MSRLRAARGFTLVEVLVAMAIFALLVSVMYGALGSVTRAFDVAEEAVDEAARLRIGNEFLSRLIESAYPVALAEGRSWVVQFTGDGRSLRFMADMPGYVGSAGVHEVVLQVREVEGESGLWLAWRPMLMSDDGKGIQGEFQERILVPGVSAMQVRYFGAENEEQAPAWSEEWSGMPGLPALVEVHLEDDDSQWPVLIQRPRANTPRYLSVRKGRRESAEPAADDGTQPAQDLERLSGTVGVEALQ